MNAIEVDAKHALTADVRDRLAVLLGAPRTPEARRNSTTAALLLDWIESRGARVRLRGAENFVNVDLNPLTDMTHERGDLLARAILGLADELRQLLLARRLTH